MDSVFFTYFFSRCVVRNVFRTRKKKATLKALIVVLLLCWSIMAGLAGLWFLAMVEKAVEAVEGTTISLAGFDLTVTQAQLAQFLYATGGIK